MNSRRRLALVLAAVLGSSGLLTAPAAAVDGRPLWSANGIVYAVATHDGVTYIGGRFTRVVDAAGTGHGVDRLAAFDQATGELIRSWSPSANDTVRAIEVGPDGTVYAGGDFTSVDGLSRTRVVAIEPDGDVVTGFRPAANRTVRSVTVIGTGVYLGGTFTRVDGQHHVGLARVEIATGDVDGGWDADVSDGRVWATETSPVPGQLLVAGSFASVAGQPRPYTASVSLLDGTPSQWEPETVCDSCSVLDLAVDGTNVYAAVGGDGGGRAAAWSALADSLRWRVRGDGNVQAVAVRDGTVYAGGHFGPEFGGAVREQLVALEASTGDLLSFRPSFSGRNHPGVWDIAADDDYLRIGGGFRDLDGTFATRYGEIAYG